VTQTASHSEPTVETAAVLVVDDRAENRLALEATLEPLGVRVICAGSGVQALYQVLSEPFAAIIMDVDMPGMDGFETASFIRRRDRSKHIPILFVTAMDSDPSQPHRAYLEGAVDYLAKPVDPTLLRAKIQVFVDLHLLRMERERMNHELETSYKELARSMQQLRGLVHRDPLTGLVNHQGLDDRLATEKQRAAHGRTPLFAMMVDLDHFDQLNRRHGQSLGDTVLRATARVLADETGPVDVVARLGGDEFIILLTDTSMAMAREVGERLRRAIESSDLGTPGGRGGVTATVGVLRIREDSNLDHILQDLREGVSVARLVGRNRITLVGPNESSHTLSPACLPSIAADTYAVAQAIVRVADEVVVGCEFLIRGTLGPLQLPRDLERLCLEAQTDVLHFVDRHCLADCMAGASDLGWDKQCNLNLFPTTLMRMDPDVLVDQLLEASADTRWCIELSEQLFVGDLDGLVAIVRRIQDRGVLIAIDDVGFGQSSVEGILKLAPDIIKIDRRFVTDAGIRPEICAALTRIVALASALGAQVIAEGVETARDLEALRELGVPYAQGFYWGRPGDPAALIR